MRVLLPSSTLPAVMKRSGCILEVALFLAPLHRYLRSLIVHARRAPLGETRRHRFLDYFLDIESCGFDRAGAADVADGAKAHRHLLHRLAGARRRERSHGHEQAAAAHHRPPVREVEGGNLQALLPDVLPDVELGPIAYRKHPHVAAGMHTRVVQAPQLGTLVARVPLAELVAHRKYPLLGARFFLVAPRAADRRVE